MRGPRPSCLAAAALALSGCSFVGVRRAPASPPPSGAALECTQSQVAPGLDTAGAIVTPLLGLGAYGLCAFMQSQQSWSSQPQDLRCGTVLWTTAGVTALYVGSAVYGFHETGECRRLAVQAASSDGEVGPLPPLPPHLVPPPPR